jgi:hypothetical protein
LTVPFFGPFWDVPALEGAVQVKTSVGRPCLCCEHEILEGERGYVRSEIGEDRQADSAIAAVIVLA